MKARTMAQISSPVQAVPFCAKMGPPPTTAPVLKDGTGGSRLKDRRVTYYLEQWSVTFIRFDIQLDQILCNLIWCWFGPALGEWWLTRHFQRVFPTCISLWLMRIVMRKSSICCCQELLGFLFRVTDKYKTFWCFRTQSVRVCFDPL